MGIYVVEYIFKAYDENYFQLFNPLVVDELILRLESELLCPLAQPLLELVGLDVLEVLLEIVLHFDEPIPESRVLQYFNSDFFCLVSVCPFQFRFVLSLLETIDQSAER